MPSRKLGAKQETMLTGSYNPWLVVVSVLVAMLAAYTALDMAGRIVATQKEGNHWWLVCGSLAMGIGIWSMHFIGMLAFSLPMKMGYDLSITLASLLIAIASSAFALWLVCQKETSQKRLMVGALVLGGGIASMHYTGMAAMEMAPPIHYNRPLLLLSIVIAVVAAAAALEIKFYLRNKTVHVVRRRAVAAMVMGIAISGMHYTGMAAAEFPAGSTCVAGHSGVNRGWLAILIIVATIAVLAIALIVSVLDVRLAARTGVLAASLEEANQQLTYMALHDGLTRLPNRLLLEDRLERAIRSACREGRRFALMFIDLDGFKGINDAYGHHVGDLLLADVAERIEACIRASDTLARVGGDEFVLLGEVGDPEDAAGLAEKVIESVGRIFECAGYRLQVTASVGIVIGDGSERDHRGLLSNADAAMYHAKALGRNGFCFFEASMNADAQEQMRLLHDLRMAVERRELVLYYQPKFDAGSKQMIGVEALLRWVHPVRGMVPPDKFIPLAEKTGLILSIGEWVLDEACRQMQAWRTHGKIAVAVNLSSVQFASAGLVELVRETLARYEVDPRCLTLEVTESTAMRNVDASMVVLQQLSEMGVHISIDDFGTGYSSLLYLKRLPATELKIDRGFVRDLTDDAEDAAIISAIVALGKALHLTVVAEGVETEAQQEFLKRLGCDSLQGYLLGRPMAAEKLSALREEAERDVVEMVDELTQQQAGHSADHFLDHSIPMLVP
jgi:diguanylate cyclase (GGDEF)-like protein